MSIDPMKGPAKGDPSQPQTPQTAPPSVAPEEKYAGQAMDPAGIWSKFLSSQSGKVATPEEVKLFLQSFQKMLQVLVQRDERKMKEAAAKLKRTIEGDDS